MSELLMNSHIVNRRESSRWVNQSQQNSNLKDLSSSVISTNNNIDNLHHQGKLSTFANTRASNMDSQLFRVGSFSNLPCADRLFQSTKSVSVLSPYSQIDSPKHSFKRFFGTLEQAEERLIRARRQEETLKDKQIQTQHSQNKIKLINSMDYITLTERMLAKELQEVKAKLKLSQFKNSKLLEDKALLQIQLEKNRAEMASTRLKARWYQTYAQDKDFQAKCLYWRQYFKQLEKTHQKFQQRRGLNNFDKHS